ncbi:MAG: hypothetical protein B6I31_01725 [Desulfobacteraceae bacterium 4572_19]|nr:MAG: hypothetical protein B6I31_01725 [Desulfobacteraceae bacterium 4572_19]
MTTIPNLNIVVQQAGKVQETQNLRNQPHEVAIPHMQQELNEIEARSIVHQAEGSEKLKSEQKKKRDRDAMSKKKKGSKRAKQKNPDGSGKFLNTVA